MKTVLTFLLVLSLAYGTFAQCDSSIVYSEELIPQCAPNDLHILWPNYENQATYYQCVSVGKSVLVSCPPQEYFNYFYQECTNCQNYIAPVRCSQLHTQNTPHCVPIGSASPTPTPAQTPTPTATTKATTTTTIVSAACNSPYTYSQELKPQCADHDVGILWPNYANESMYYMCNGAGNPVLVACPYEEYFNYVYQECTTCQYYIPPIPCSELRTQNTPTCVPISAATTTKPPITIPQTTTTPSAEPDTTTTEGVSTKNGANTTETETTPCDTTTPTADKTSLPDIPTPPKETIPDNASTMDPDIPPPPAVPTTPASA